MSEVDEFNFGQEVPVYREFTEADVEEIRYELNKYDGDFTAEEIHEGVAGEPVETIVVINGEIVEHIINGEVQTSSITGSEGGD